MIKKVAALGWILLLLCVACGASADVSRAQEDLVQLVQKNLIRNLGKAPVSPRFPLPLLGRRVLVIGYLGGGYRKVLLIGSPALLGMELADRLSRVANKLNLKGDITYSDDDDYSAAEFDIATPHGFGQMNGTTQTPMGAFVDEIQAFNLQPEAVVRTSSDAKVEGLGEPITSTTVDVYDARHLPPDGNVTVKVSMPALAKPVLLGWCFMLPVLIYGGFGLGAWVAKRKSLPLAYRRKFYAAAIRTGAFGGIGLNFVVFMILVGTNWIHAITDLWFGSYLVTGLVPIIGVGPLLAIPIIPFGANVERELKMEALPEDKRIAYEARFPAKTPSRVGLFTRLSFFIVILIGLGLISAFPQKAPTVGPIIIVLAAASMVFRVYSMRNSKSKQPQGSEATLEPPIGDREVNQRLSARAFELSRMMDVEAKGVRLYDPFSPRLALDHGNGNVKESIYMSKAVYEKVSPEAMDFGIASRLALAQFSDPRKTLVIVGVGFVPFFLFQFAMITHQFTPSPASLSFIFALLFLPFPLATLVITKMRRADLLRADKWALEATKDRQAALQYLDAEAEAKRQSGTVNEAKFAKRRAAIETMPLAATPLHRQQANPDSDAPY